ncbi:MAG: hypothetical protein IPN01_12175 [Deltaproteobacteria bacterium]|nr:hypothetical protein [Deltaproteobacteria bacterium]
MSAELGPNPPPESFLKTRSTLQAALASVGAIERSGSAARTTRARHGRPDPLAWCWSLAVELRERGEQTEAVITRRCFASRLFTLRPEVIDGYVELGLSEGLLRRGYLMGQALLSAGEGLR